METQQIQNIKQLVDIAGRRKAVIVSCILLSIAMGLGVYLIQPKVYMSTCLLSYQQQSVNPAKMSPEINTKIKDVVSTLTQIISSRTSLEEIINSEGLYKKERENLPMEDVIETMRRNINIIPSKDGDTFSISFTGSNPNKVVRVTNSLSSRFIEENMKYREERASETSAYTKDELSMVKEMLDSKEAVMRDYKLKYYNEMADQRTSNTERLIALQTQYQSRQDSIQHLEQTRVLMRDQLAVKKEELENRRYNSAQMILSGPSQVRRGAETLDQLQAELKTLQERYTDQHPRVKSLKKKIANFNQTGLNKTASEASAEKGKQSTSENFEIQNQMHEISLNIEKLNKEREEIKVLIKQYEQWVAAAPVREAEWSALTREYGELKHRYDFLVGQNLQADSALNLERKQKGSQFKIEDSARMPEKPVKPVFLKIMGIALLVGCGLGGVLVFGLELLDTSFRDPDKLEETLKLEVICSVPHLPLKREIASQRKWTIVGTVFFLAWGATIVLAIVFFWKQGRIVF
jgi:polysaccharide chain length determinant protein (PEP-CTERM system associated)